MTDAPKPKPEQASRASPTSRKPAVSKPASKRAPKKNGPGFWVFIGCLMALILFADLAWFWDAVHGASFDALPGRSGPYPGELAFDRTKHAYSAGQFTAVSVSLLVLIPFFLGIYIAITALVKRMRKRDFDPARNVWLFAVITTGLMTAWCAFALITVIHWHREGRPYSNYEAGSYGWPIGEQIFGIVLWGTAFVALITHYPLPESARRKRKRKPLSKRDQKWVQKVRAENAKAAEGTKPSEEPTVADTPSNKA